MEIGGDLPAILRTHAESMWSEGWYTVSMALSKAADEIERLRGAECGSPTPDGAKP